MRRHGVSTRTSPSRREGDGQLDDGRGTRSDGSEKLGRLETGADLRGQRFGKEVRRARPRRQQQRDGGRAGTRICRGCIVRRVFDAVGGRASGPLERVLLRAQPVESLLAHGPDLQVQRLTPNQFVAMVAIEVAGGNRTDPVRRVNDGRGVGGGQPDPDFRGMPVPLEGGTIVAAIAVEVADNGVVVGRGDDARREQETGARDCEDSATRAPGAQ